MRFPVQRGRMMALLAAALLLTAACGGASPSSSTASAQATASAPAATAQKILTVVQASDAITLDPQNTGDNPGLGVERAIYDGLFGFDQNMKVIPELAKSWTASPNGTVFTIKLQPNAKFSDGTPVDAAAVKANFDRVRNKANHLQKYSLYYMIKDIKVIDPLTVEFDLSFPFSAFIENLAHPSGGLISPAAIQKYGKDVATHPVGAGPYMVTQWVHGDHITMKPNPYYWRGKPYFDQVVFKAVPDASQRLAMIKTGEAQFVYPMDPVNAKALAGQSGITVENKPSIFVTYLTMNQLHAPFNNQNVRLALNYAIDRQALVSSLYQGDAQIMHSQIGTLLPDYKDVGTYPYDVAKAKQLLAQAGYPNGFTATLWTGNDSFSQEEGVFLQQQLAQVGVKINLVPMESGTLNAAIFQPPAQNKSQLLLTGFSPSNGSTDWALRATVSKSAFPPNLFNFGFFDDPKVDQLIQDALTTTSASQQGSDYAQVQQLLFQDAATVWLVAPTNVWAEASNLQNAFVVPDQTIEVQMATEK